MATMTALAAAELFRTTPDRFIDVGAGEVAYRRVGTGPDVLFVHGWPVSGATYRHLLAHLVDHVTCHVIDLPSAGSSRFDGSTPMSVDHHIESVRRVVDRLELTSVAAIGHDSGGLIARHALAGDPRLRALGLFNTETSDPGWRFNALVRSGKLPGFGSALRWLVGRPRLRRNRFVLGDAFADPGLLDGEFDEFFLQPLRDPMRCEAAMKILRSYRIEHVRELDRLHARIDVPVKLVWGDRDPYFPLDRAVAMAATFPNATIEVVEGAGLFVHEEAPARAAEALLPVLTVPAAA